MNYIYKFGISKKTIKKANNPEMQKTKWVDIKKENFHHHLYIVRH